MAAHVPVHASAYDARPKLVVVIVIDQLRADILPRNASHFGPDGFRMFTERGAYFPVARYQYANTHTAPGHASVFTGTYSNGHGIIGNQWWDPESKRVVTSVYDATTKVVGSAPGSEAGASPRRLLATGIADELKLATGGKSRVFGVSLKDRSAILSTGFSADGAYWVDRLTGEWVTSTYYRNELPAWVARFNSEKRADKYWNLEWKDSSGKVLRRTKDEKRADGTRVGWYDVVGATPFGTDYQFEFVRELITNEKLGQGPTTDLLVFSLSGFDILGHKVGAEHEQMTALTLALDRQLAEFFGFLGRQIGLANVWVALTADHGIPPVPAFARGLRLPATAFHEPDIRKQLNQELATRFGKPGNYIAYTDWVVVYLSAEAFTAAGVKQADAEKAASELLLKYPFVRSVVTRTQMEEDRLPHGDMGRKYGNSYSPHGGWYVMVVPTPYSVSYTTGTDHSAPLSYDTDVPLAFYGVPFQPGTYRQHVEPIDLAPTLASLLGILAPSHSTGRVLTEALAPAANAPRATTSRRPRDE